MENIVGKPARGENFFTRDREVGKILTSISSGNNIQIAAPRRVGKTSMLFYMLDNLVKDYLYVYIDTESICTEEDFYKKLLKEILKLKGIASRVTAFMKAAEKYARKIKSIKVLDSGIDFQEAIEGLSYYDDLIDVLSGIQLEGNRKLILLIDEFPQTILNIMNTSGTRAAIHFLQSNRALRLNPDIMDKVSFIYTGSIGLNHTVASIDSTAFINDLNALEIAPLNRKEAGSLLEQLLSTRSYSIKPTANEHLLNKMEWLIPFHIQLLVQELLIQDIPDKIIDIKHIDQAFEQIIATRNNHHFAHYCSRLKSQFKGDELRYVLEIMDQLADTGTISYIRLLDQAVPFNTTHQLKKIIDVLVYDGYINNIGNKEIYQFNSPIIRMWWQKNICK